jgi:transposase-like protein
MPDRFGVLSNGGFLVHRSHYGAKMNKKSGTSKDAADKLVRGIKRKTRKQYSAEEKIRIVLAGLRGEESIAALCRREGSARACTIRGRRNSLKRASNRLAGIRPARRRRLRSRTAFGISGAEGGRCRPDAGEPSAQKKHDRGWGGRGMRYPASEKLEIIRTVEASHLPTRQTLKMLGIPSSTYYDWYDRWSRAGSTRLRSRPTRVCLEPHPG